MDAGEIFRAHHLSVFRYLRRMTGDRAAAEELAQEVFLRVARAAASYREQGRVEAWLFRIARNVLLNRRRSAARSPGLEPLEGVEPAQRPAGETRVALQQGLGRLAEAEREAFLLREVGGLSYDEIAALCDTSAGAIRSRIYRARLELRAGLSDVAHRGSTDVAEETS